MIYELIRTSIETKLNNNTANKKFVVGSYAKVDDDDNAEHFIYNVRTSYKTIETDFIASMVEMDIEYQAIPDQLNGNATVNISFLLNGDKQDLIETDLSTLNEFIAKIVGNSEDLGTTTVYHTVWNCSGIIPNGLTSPINGRYYTRVSMSVYIEFSDTNYFGNRYEYFLGTTNVVANLTQILPYDGHVMRDNTENYPQRITGYEALGGNEESFWSSHMKVYVNAFIDTNILTDISSDTYDLTKKLFYQEKKNGTTGNGFWVNIKNITKPILLGEKQYITFDLFKSDYVAES